MTSFGDLYVAILSSHIDQGLKAQHGLLPQPSSQTEEWRFPHWLASVSTVALEHFVSGRLASCLPSCMDSGMNIYSPTFLLFLSMIPLNGTGAVTSAAGDLCPETLAWLSGA